MPSALQLYLRNHDVRSNSQIKDSNPEMSSEPIQTSKAEPVMKIIKAFSS